MYNSQNKIVFLDRDGVICEEKDLLYKKEDFILMKGAAEAISLLNKNKYMIIVITNQPVIARGLCTIAELEEIHKYMNLLLAEKDAKIDKIYYCPHHPNPKGKIGLNGPVQKYVMECECRKPKSGMILQAKKDLSIMNLSQCFMVGDSISDIKAGHDAGCKTILIEKEKPDLFNDAIPDFRAKDLYDAVVNIILKKEDETVH